MLPLAPLLKIYNMLISAILKQDFFYRSGLISNQMTHWFKSLILTTSKHPNHGYYNYCSYSYSHITQKTLETLISSSGLVPI